jgi:hypothetical protein
MSEQELILNVKELHVLSVTCTECGRGTIFDFQNSDCLKTVVSPRCGICNAELAFDLQEQLKAYRRFYDSMSLVDRIEFRVRLHCPEPAGAAEVQQVLSTAVTEVQQAVTKAFAKEHGMADLVGGPFRGFGAQK